ncbi:hypothetical protein WH87_06910 [Devosia epidermidihirudinis]|uniref:NADH:quinone oxidoreductase/Mrp antiporter transmembrane domain-containing protein n=1 Tax=Devosia epidermidihirudinis TaxID=1293439 RepID=A0A0F5QIJ0_9HYPH|nr:proton-conducting transporter membrane subunit [Devosia epidermidihirudinis]KKC39839.1 hypothetical protein WH87_06910 [Devosia epidermidihirudinis]
MDGMQQTATIIADWIVVLPLVLALMGAAALVMRRSSTSSAVLAICVVLTIIACEIALLLRVSFAGPLSMTMGNWLPPFGISFAADAFGVVFALTAALVTLAVLVYAQGERASNDGRDGFHALVLLLLAGVTGSFLTGDLFNLYVWFEVMLIASFGLIVLGGSPAQLDGAVKYGFLNFLATTLFLLSLGLIYGLLGTLNMADILRVAPDANPAALTGIAALLLLAFGMKAAAFPLNAWLPASYHTPPVVISALMAGLLTKVGAYALLRVLILLLPSSREVLEPVLVVIAVATLLTAPLGAIAETNLRRALGFLVIGGIGAVVAGIAIGSHTAVAGAGFYIVHAMLTMTALYLVAGLIERMTGETDSRRMGGLYAASAPLSILFFVLMLAAAGVPPLLGFWPKLLLLQAGLEQGDWGGIALVVALILNAVLTLIAVSRLWAHMFWRDGMEGSGAEPQPLVVLSRNEAWLRYGTAGVLTAAVVALGLWPNGLLEIIGTGAFDMIDPSRYVSAVGLAGGTP